MKLDKFMEISFKILAVITACIVIVGAVQSCFHSPVIACAFDASVQEGAETYLDTFAQNLNGLSIDWSEDEDGNRHTKLEIVSLQQLALQNQENFYSSLDWASAPSTFTVSGSGNSALYRTSAQGSIKVCTIFKVGYTFGDFIFISAPDFSFKIEAPENYQGSTTIKSDSSSYQYWSVVTRHTTGSRDNVNIVGSGLGISFSFTNPSSVERYWKLEKFSQFTAIPIISTSFALGPSYDGSAPTLGITGSNQVTLPSETVDTTTPWDYYNNTLRPYIINEYGDDIENIEQYLVFPDGYQPPVQPIEPPTQNPNSVTPVIPVIIGIPIPIDIDDALGNILDALDVFADLLPNGGLQINIDGITFQFERGGSGGSSGSGGSNRVIINGTQYPIPLPDINLDGHIINIPDITHFTFDGVDFVINADSTLTINGKTYNLPIGQPTTVPVSADEYVYQYEIPTLENLNIVDATLSAPDLSEYADGINWIWLAVEKVLSESGLMPILIICLSLSAVSYALWKIGG